MRKPLIDKDGEVRELTAEDFKRMRPAREAMTDLVKAYEEGRLRVRGLQKMPTKTQLTLRLSRDSVETFKAGGRGWQARIDKALKEWLKEHSPA